MNLRPNHGMPRMAAMVVVAAFLVGTLCPTALAQDEEEARTQFLRGVELADAERWGEAVQYFERSRRILERPSTLFNLGLALFRLARHTDAIEVLERYVAIAGTDESERRAQAERMLRDARGARGTLELSVSPETAQVRINDAIQAGRGSERRLTLDPGRHRLRVDARGYAHQVLTVEIVPGERTVAAAELERTSGTDTADSSAGWANPVLGSSVDSDEDGGSSLLKSPIFWVIAGAVVVGAGVGIGVAASSSSTDAPPPYGGTTGVVLMY